MQRIRKARRDGRGRHGPAVATLPAADPSGDFVVVWRSYGLQDGDAAAVIGQRYSQIVPVSLTGFAVE